MTQNSEACQIKIITDAALHCAADKPWSQVTMKDIADKSDLDVTLIHKLVDNRSILLQWVWDELDKELIAEYSEIGQEDAERHEKLFEAMMCRFDKMQDQRAAYLSIYHAAWKDPVFMKRFFTDIQDSMINMLHFLKIDLSILGTYHGSALTLAILYTHVLRTWAEDESADMSQTMAELDKRLGQIGGVYHKLQNFLGRGQTTSNVAMSD